MKLRLFEQEPTEQTEIGFRFGFLIVEGTEMLFGNVIPVLDSGNSIAVPAIV